MISISSRKRFIKPMLMNYVLYFYLLYDHTCIYKDISILILLILSIGFKYLQRFPVSISSVVLDDSLLLL